MLDNVVELGERCFCYCKSFRCVRFSLSAKLHRIGDPCFAESPLGSCKIPGPVVKVGRVSVVIVICLAKLLSVIMMLFLCSLCAAQQN